MSPEIITLIFVIGLHVFSEIRNYLERKSLLDRLMASSLSELVDAEIQRTKSKKKPEREEKFYSL